MEVPYKVMTAQYLVNQFEHADFEFGCVHKEEKLMDEYEDLIKKELRILGGHHG